MVDTIINIIKTIQELITNLVKWILSVFDVFGILFTYISILLVTVLIVTSYSHGGLLTPTVGCIIIFTLIYVNKNLKGGGN